MRAALLPTPGDPFMLSYWLRNHETWRDQVDELVVIVNGQRNPDVLAYDRRIVEEAGGRFTAVEHSLGHDGAMRWLLENTEADHIVMCEDDAYVRRPEAVGRAFGRIESGATDLVGSPRHEDYAGQTQEWGPYTPGDLAELRHGLWPAFLFARRADLLATDRIFGDRGFPRGGTIPGWGPVTAAACDYIGIGAEFVHLDTFFGTTFQLRAAGLRTELIHHVRLYDPAATEQWLVEDPPWFHVTNLSTIGYVVPNVHTPGLDERVPIERIPDCGPGGGLWTRRVAWWLRTWRTADDKARRTLPDYSAHIEAFIVVTGMDPYLGGWDVLFDPWVTWPERARVAA